MTTRKKETVLCYFKIIKFHNEFELKAILRKDMRLEYVFKYQQNIIFYSIRSYQVELSSTRFSKYSTDLNLLMNDRIKQRFFCYFSLF